ncbi:MAG: phosphoribosylformylglycinamidine synthase subunit PurQ [Hyphomicrobiales bacterium]|nr:phosphoribosylformylglycinamidine synthase subunit PurQ [Hyphomicrobiales bacterium]
MKASVIVFPGSNCDRDVAVCLEAATGAKPTMVWHGDADVPASDLIVLPGGFSYGDYLRSGAMAAHSPVMRDVVAKARKGITILGICNGFQVLTESGLLPGVLMRNASLKFICRDVTLKVERNDTVFAGQYGEGDIITIPVAHHDGNYFTDRDTLERLEGENRVAFRYCDATGALDETANPNGSLHNIAGIYDETGRVLGLMPHPERLADAALGGTDGKHMFTSLVEALH